MVSKGSEGHASSLLKVCNNKAASRLSLQLIRICQALAFTALIFCSAHHFIHDGFKYLYLLISCIMMINSLLITW